MKLKLFIWSQPYGPALRSTAFARFCHYFLLAGVLGISISAVAKDAPATAIALFDGPQGAAYVQISGVTLNGKTDLRICDGVSKFDKGAYDSLPRVSLAGATSLQRSNDGVLTLTVNGKPICVVPANLKFDRKPELTPADAAEQSLLQGVPVSSSLQELAIPTFKAGMQLVFIPAPDAEMAEYLRAQRASTVKDWEDFLVSHPASTHFADAKNAMAGLHQQAAEAAFAQYQKSSAAHKPDIGLLRQSCTEAQAANQAVSGYASAVKLIETIGRELDMLLEPDRARLQAFQKAVQEHSPGYSQLAAARAHVHLLVEVQPDYAPVLNLRRDIGVEERKLETTVVNAESLVSSGRYDDAVTSLGPYSAFAAEIPRMDAIIAAAYQYHFDSGQKLATAQEWAQSVAEFRKAAAIRPDNKDAQAALKNASTQLAAKRDQQEANLALLQSKEFANKSQFVEAYNVLAELPDTQRALVSSELSSLGPQYVPAATRRALKLQEVHLPIKSRADEDAVREAYVLLDRASTVSGDPAITLKRDFLSNKISSYYVDQASRYLGKPSGSGAGVGWLYLKEAQRFGITNANTLKDQMAQYTSLYQRRARLSVGIVLRDQTSRRDNPGFAEQLAAAIANGLDSSGVSIEVVRKPSEAGDALQPNFMIVGEILEHRVVKNTNLETLQSKYRAGTHEVKSPAWLQANDSYQSAQQQLATAQHALSDAQSQHKKKEMVAAASDAVQTAQKQADDLRHKLDTTEQSRVEAIVEPYHYSRKNFDLTASIDLAFRINDRLGNSTGDPVSVHKDNHKTAVVVQDVKPEDTEGVTNQGVEPDETQFLADLEIEARNTLIKVIQQKASELPARILQEARTRAQRGDLDGAAEQYVMYLNSTPDSSSAEHDEAAKFLHDQFNLAAPVASKL
jgi:tetratricopeptide (TPR) repeat protein